MSRLTRAQNQKFQKLVPKLREKGFYKHKEVRQISWSQYTISQIKEAKEILKFIRDSVDKCNLFSSNGKIGRPLTDPKILAKAVLTSEFLQSPERQSQGWLEIIGSFIGISQILDDRVIGEAYNNPEVLYILKQIFDNSKNSDGKLSGDGTGLETSRKQNYESNKETGDYMTSIVDSREIVQAFDVSGKQECRAMHDLIKEVDGNSLRLDAGFIDRNLVKEISDLKMIPYIFPKKNTILNGSLAWKNMYLSLYNDVMKWLEEYHQRSHTESFHSSFKRRNKIIMKRRPTARLSQITARIILHNKKKLSYYDRLA